MRRNTGTQFFMTLFFVLFAAIINYGISFAITPYITNTLGTEAYGFVSLARTFANYASIITVAVNSVATRYISVEYHQRRIENARKYYTSLFVADIILDIVIFLGSLAVIVNLEYFLDISIELQFDVKWLFVLTMVNFCIISASTVFNSATLIKNRLDIGAVFKICAYISEALILYFSFSIAYPHVFYVGIALIGSSLVLMLANYIYTKKEVKELFIKKIYFDIKAVKEVFLKGIWYSLNSLGNVLNSGLDLWVSNLMLSAFQMGQLAIVKTVTTISTALYQLAAQPLQPLLLRQYANSEKDKLANTLKLGIKVNGYLSNILFGFFAVFGIAYYKLWTPSQDSNLLYSITLITVLGGVIEGAVNPLYYTYVLTLKNKIPCIATLISGLANVLGMYILINYFNGGLSCVVGTTAVLTWLINFLFTPMYSAHCLKLRKTIFYPTLIRNIISCIGMTILFKCISILIFPVTWIEIILVGVLCCLIGGAIHLLIVFDKNEIELIKTAITSRFVARR